MAELTVGFCKDVDVAVAAALVCAWLLDAAAKTGNWVRHCRQLLQVDSSAVAGRTDRSPGPQLPSPRLAPRIRQTGGTSGLLLSKPAQNEEKKLFYFSQHIYEHEHSTWIFISLARFPN